MLIGKPIDRRDGFLKVTGGARYAAEWERPGLAHAVFVDATIPAGQVRAIDDTAARALPGVLAVITAANAERLAVKPGGQKNVHFGLLQSGAVYNQGQPIAVVIADTFERATAAAASLRVSYDSAPAVTVMDAALDHARLPEHFRNGARPPDSARGDATGAFDTASIKVDATYRTPIEHHNPMEPHATIAEWQGGKLTVWTTTQGISQAQATIAATFGLQPRDVTVLSPFLGGGFGSKGNTWEPALLAVMAARAVGRPVRLVVTREQMFTANGYRPRTVQRVRLGASADGTLVAVMHDGITQSSLPVLGEFAEPVALAAEMLYASPNAAITHRLVDVNASLPTFMRAPGEASGVFALESAMDELAVASGLDPIELRMRNYAENDPSDGKPFGSKALLECYRRGAASFGWSRRSPQPRSMREGDILVGYGMATSTYPTNRMPASARVRLRADGTILVQSGTQDIGTGTYTTMAQVAGDVLGAGVGRITVQLGDSRLPPAPVSGGSMTSASVLPAVQAAAIAVRDKAIAGAIAGGGDAWRGVDPANVTLRDGVLIGPSGLRLPIGALLGRMHQGFIEAVADVKSSEDAARHSLHAFGAQFCEVHVDQALGRIRLARFVGAFDCGRIMNAKTARSQLIGGIVYGIGMALFEETRVDAASGRIVNANLAEYLVPTHADMPTIETIVVESDDPVSNPLGVKGIGELPMVGVAPAIANAVYHATGRRLRDLPLRVEAVLA